MHFPFALRIYVLCALGVTSTLAGCASLQYYGQAIRGHFGVLAARQPLAVLVDDPTTSPNLRAKLKLAYAARRFASRRLALPDNGSYLQYADLQRPYVVWNVFAAPTLSLQLVQSCFVLVGCLDYRGYFSEAAARRFAETLRAQGYEVYVGGVAAYSTLGWFDDPLLNTMLRWSDAELVKTIFHELAHQLIYVSGDSTFNESFATALADYGFERWRTEDEAARLIKDDTGRGRELAGLLQHFRARLTQVYVSAASPAQKTTEKNEVFAALTREYQTLKARWGGTSEYDSWMAVDLNNAKLASIATYHEYVPGFMAIMRCSDHDLARFYATVRDVAAWPASDRRQALVAAAASSTCSSMR